MREWSYWTRNKLMILEEYLPVLVKASKTARHAPVYLDLMAGEPENLSRETREWFDGSARRAMACQPPLGQVILFERNPDKAAALASDLAQQFPGDGRARVITGDCNATIAGELARLRKAGLSSAPMFAFLDQQVAEISWETIQSLARFRQGRFKVEMWMLLSPTMFNRSLGPRTQLRSAQMAAVDRMYGINDWQRILRAQEAKVISPAQARKEYVNLMRWRLQNDLGYAFTASLPMHMDKGMEIYEMLFTTDHAVGSKVMSHLYRKAADKEPELMAQAAAARMNRRAAERALTLFPFEADEMSPALDGEWEPTPVHDPTDLPWWDVV